MENNFLSLIKTRRSVRVYKSEPVPAEALDAVLEAGTYAPTGGGRQSPTIIAITDPKYRQEIAKLNAEVMGSIMHLPAEDVNPLPSLQLQTPNIDRRSQN